MRLDLHTHSVHSADSVNRVETIFRAAKSLGMGVAVTDHNSIGAWGEAEKLSRKMRVPWIRGEEVQVFDGEEAVGEYIALFINKEIRPGNYLEVLNEIHAQGGLAIVAHPFDRYRRRFKRLEKVKKKVDGIEAFNSRCYLSSFNKKAEKFAEKNSLPKTAGSDGHLPKEVGRAFTEVNCSSVEEAYNEIKKGRTKIFGRKSSMLIHLYTPLIKNELISDK